MTWRQALEASIKIWRKRANGETVDTECPLCMLAYIKYKYSKCGDCPAIKKEGDDCCGGLYVRWYNNKTTKNAEIVLKYLIALRKHPKCSIRKK